jgi:hypothetical protein
MGSRVALRDDVFGALEKKTSLSIEPDSLVFPVLTELPRSLNITITYCYTEFESPNITSAPEFGMFAMLLWSMFRG